jgi:hypothetical protein
MLDHLIRYDRAGPIADDLVDIDDETTTLVGPEASGLDVGINHTPLARPVVAHTVATVDPPALHPVRPVHVRMHDREGRRDVARIECVVGAAEEIAIRGHGGVTPHPAPS